MNGELFICMVIVFPSLITFGVCIWHIDKQIDGISDKIKSLTKEMNDVKDDIENIEIYVLNKGKTK